MRYLSHIDPGNSGGSVPAPESPFGVYQPKPVTFECPICHASFLSKEEMRSHRIAEHPVKRPYLLFNGRAYLKPELVIHETLTPDSIDFLDTLSAVVDGQPIDSADELKDVLLSKQTYRESFQNIEIATNGSFSPLIQNNLDELLVLSQDNDSDHKLTLSLAEFLLEKRGKP